MKKIMLGALALAALVAGPALTYAATYAYVDTTGEVKSMTATDAMTALNTAPGIHMHSGVMIIDDTSDNAVVGDDVPGA